KAVIPKMLESGSGYFLMTCSSAGLLTALGAAPYTVTKHASVALAEWLAITDGKKGIIVSALCPSAVDTDMLNNAAKSDAASAVKAGGDVMKPEAVAEITIKNIEKENFLIITHDDVKGFIKKKSDDIERWIRGMQKIALASEMISE